MTRSLVPYGHVYRIRLDPETRVIGVIVSSNRLNSQFDTYIAAQVAVSKEHDGTLGSVRLNSGDPVFGYIICRDIGMIHDEEILEELGPLSLETRTEMERTLRSVLGP